jgi:hypothetical protein
MQFFCLELLPLRFWCAKLSLSTAPRRHCREFDLFLTSAVIGMVRFTFRPPQRKIPLPWCPVRRRPGVRQSQSWLRGRDIPLVLSPVGSQVLGPSARSSVTCQPRNQSVGAISREVRKSCTHSRSEVASALHLRMGNVIWCTLTYLVQKLRQSVKYETCFAHHSCVFQLPRRSHHHAVHRIVKREL